MSAQVINIFRTKHRTLAQHNARIREALSRLSEWRDEERKLDEQNKAFEAVGKSIRQEDELNGKR